MSTATNPCCHSLFFRHAPPNSRFSIRVHLKPLLPRFPLNSSTHCVSTLSRRRRNKWEIVCFRREESSQEHFESKSVEDKLAEELVPTPEINQPSDPRKGWASSLYKALESIFVTKPWVVPWTAKTIVQVMLLWVASFWVIGSWIIPIIAHTAGYRKEFMTYRGQALYSLLTDVVEGLTGMAILHRCLSRFHPLPQGWFNFRFEGKWQFDVGLGCLMFPLVNRLSQVNLNLLPILPSAPVTVSSVEQSIIARDPVAMALYAVVVSVCAPIWEEIVFRGFLLPSLKNRFLSFSLSLSLANVSSSSYLSIPIMSSAADPVASSDAPATVAVVAPPVENDSKSKKAAASKASKAKKPSGAKRTRSSPTHPPFFEMISEAIVSLKERTGSSQYAITKFSEEKHKQLPSNFRKLLLVHLKKLVAADKLVKVKNSYKLPSARSKAAAAPVVAKKPASSKLKAAVSVKKAAVAKPKAKTAVKPKPKVVAKPKAAAKSKVVGKPKAVAPAKRKAAEKVKKVAPKPKPAAKPAKVAKTLSRASPGKKAAPAAKAKKVAAKKPKTVKSPARKVQARKVKK